MEIEKVIEIFAKCIPYYQKACDEKWTNTQIFYYHLDNGLCYFLYYTFGLKVGNLFSHHYKHYFTHGRYLFSPVLIHNKNAIEKSILPRLNFLKTEVKRLKRLQKQGYTHI